MLRAGAADEDIERVTGFDLMHIIELRAVRAAAGWPQAAKDMRPDLNPDQR